MPIIWRSGMSVGEPLIDTDHKHLIELLNSYEDAVHSKDLTLLKSTFEGLLKYTETHFNREEDLMQAIHYKGLGDHRLAHQDLLDELKVFHKQILSKTGHIALPLVSKFLHDWLVNHVLNEDMKLKPLLEGGMHLNAEIDWNKPAP